MVFLLFYVSLRFSFYPRPSSQLKHANIKTNSQNSLLAENWYVTVAWDILQDIEICYLIITSANYYCYYYYYYF